MILKKDSLKPIDFSGLKIYDFTEGLELSSSFVHNYFFFCFQFKPPHSMKIV